MAEQPIDGQPFDDGPDDDAVIEGTVVPFPGPAPAPAKPQRGGQPGELRDIIPPHLRTWQGIRKALRWHCRRAQHHALYHAVQVAQAARPDAAVGRASASPGSCSRSSAGGGSSSRRTSAMRWSPRGDTQKWLSLHKHAREVRLVRGLVLLGEVLALALAAGVVTSYAPVLWLPIAAAAVPGAGMGRAAPPTSRS